MNSAPKNSISFEVLKGNSLGISKETLTRKGYLSLSHSQKAELSKLPKTRFYGSKRRLANWLHSAFSDLEFETCLDAFGGTATVSLIFKIMNKNVTYNDILQSNSMSAKALLSNENLNISKDILDSYIPNEITNNGIISRTFKDTFYYDDENEWLDSFIKSTQHIKNELLKSEIYYCLFQACIQKRPFNLFHRKNLYIRTDCSQNTKFGNWKTWARNFEELMLRSLSELEQCRTIKNKKVNILESLDASEIKPGFDLVYIDPPYVSQASNELTYMDRYHFLEGILDYERWEERINFSKKSRPIYSNDALISWNKKNSFKDRLYSFIENHKESTVALSYVTNAFPDQTEIIEKFKIFFKDVIVIYQDLPHALSKKQKTEILIIGKN